MPSARKLIFSVISFATVTSTLVLCYWAHNYFSLKKLKNYDEELQKVNKCRVPSKLHFRVINLDGALLLQEKLLSVLSGVEVIDATDLSNRLRIQCNFADWFKFERRIAEITQSQTDEKLYNDQASSIVTFYGSNDFHHVTLALTRRLGAIFNFVILDNHPDWIQWYPGLHCGCWMSHVVHLPTCKHAFHLGGSSSEFTLRDVCYLTPWNLLKSKLSVFPSTNKFAGNKWDSVEQKVLRDRWFVPLTKERLLNLLEPHFQSLKSCPVYISIDKDVMSREYAIQNWNSGELLIEEVLVIVETFIELSGNRLLGLDITGEFSIAKRSFFQRLRDKLMRSDSSCKEEIALQNLSNVLNEKTNIRIIDHVNKVMFDFHNDAPPMNDLSKKSSNAPEHTSTHDQEASNMTTEANEDIAPIIEDIEESEDEESEKFKSHESVRSNEILSNEDDESEDNDGPNAEFYLDNVRTE